MALTTSLFGGLSIGLAVAALAGVLLLHVGLRWPLVLVLLMTFCLPFERIPSVDVAGVSLRLNHLIGLAGIVTVALKLLVDRWPTRPYPAAPWLVSFLALSLVGVSQSVAVAPGVKTFAFILFTSLLSAVVVQLVRSTDDLRRLLRVLAASAVVVVLFSLYQTAGDIVGLPTALTGLKLGYTKMVLGFPRPQAFSIEPLYLANYLFLPLGIFSALWLTGGQKSEVGGQRSDFRLLISGMLLVIALTISRGAWLALIPFAAVVALTMAPRFFTVRSLGTLMVALVLVLAGTTAFLSVSREDALSQFVEHAQLGDLQAGESTQGRLGAFREAVRAWQGAPLLGIGLGNFGSFVKGYPDPREVAISDIVNNEYLEVLAETGLVGFALMAGFVLALLVRHVVALSRSREELHRAVLVGLLAAFIATLAQYNFFSTLYVLPIWFLIGLMVAVQNLVLAGDDVRRTNYDVRRKE